MEKPTTIFFHDFPDFTPNLTPIQIFKLGSFGGGYWRPIFSGVQNRQLQNRHLLKRIKPIFEHFNQNETQKLLTSSDYQISVNRYKVKCGSSLIDWESKNWIIKQDPYGWVEWYCHFFQGRRSKDDSRQIDRWKKLAGPNGRFRKRLINMIKKNNKNFDDFSVSPVIRQTLQHWGYVITKKDL
mgnify:CR=1 FL=1